METDLGSIILNACYDVGLKPVGVLAFNDDEYGPYLVLSYANDEGLRVTIDYYPRDGAIIVTYLTKPASIVERDYNKPIEEYIPQMVNDIKRYLNSKEKHE